MSIFIDSADIDEIQELIQWGVVSGCTTNPAIAAKVAHSKGRFNFKERVLQIIEVVRGPVSVELLSEGSAEMIEEARTYYRWNEEYVVIKVPIGEEGLKVINTLERQDGIKANATCIMSFNQAYLAALAGASYVSIFSGRVRDMGYDSEAVIHQTREFIRNHNLSTKIIVGSVRHMMDVNHAFQAGAHIVTVTPDVLRKMVYNPRTEQTVAEFNQKWKIMKEEGLIL